MRVLNAVDACRPVVIYPSGGIGDHIVAVPALRALALTPRSIGFDLGEGISAGILWRARAKKGVRSGIPRHKRGGLQNGSIPPPAQRKIT